MFSTLSSRAGCRSFCSSSLDPSTPPLPLLQALYLLLQDSSVLCLWTFIIGLGSPPKAKAPVFSPAGSGVSSAPSIPEDTAQGCGSQPAAFAYDPPSSPGKVVFLPRTRFLPWGAG